MNVPSAPTPRPGSLRRASSDPRRADGARPLALLRTLLVVGGPPATDLLAVLALVATPLGGPAPLAAAVGAVAVALLVPRPGGGRTGRAVLPRTALVAVAVLQQPPSPVWIAGLAVCVALQLEPVAVRLGGAAVPVAAHLPGVRTRNTAAIPVGRLFAVDTVAVLAVAIAGLVGRTDVPALVVGAAAVAVAATVCTDAGLRIRARRTADPAITAALEAVAPRFALHWDATPGTEYQVTMWLPHLERIGTPFVVVVRNPATFAAIAAATPAPVLLRRHPADLDAVVVPSLRTAFYVNNAARNTHLVRFAGLEHVQLGHGDSDKAPSFSPVFRMYTRAFVPGPAAVERFASNGVRVPDDLLTVVGRPQVSGMLVGAATSDVPTALYAPTWAGANADTAHSSLPIGVAIVEALVASGYRVVFRPHPYTRRDPALAAQSDRIDALLARDARRTGRAHLHAAASAALDLLECCDAAHLLVADVSSVVTDFLHSEKPYLLTAMAPDGEEPRVGSPLAAGGYVVDRAGSGLEAAIALASGGDPLLAARRAVKAHVLGDFGGEDPAEVFLRHAREVVLGPSRQGQRA